MYLSREELLRQKRLVETQLRWIESKLEQLDTPPVAADAPPPGHTPAAEADLELIRQKETLNPSSARLGCIVLFALLSALALFVLFVLPYWIRS